MNDNICRGVNINRPNKKDYWHIETEEILDLDEYYDDLEKYCDDIESMYDGLSKTLDTVSDYNEELERENKRLTSLNNMLDKQNYDNLHEYYDLMLELSNYARALNKACRYLTYDHFTPLNELEGEEMVRWNEEEWKEFLLKDE